MRQAGARPVAFRGFSGLAPAAQTLARSPAHFAPAALGPMASPFSRVSVSKRHGEGNDIMPRRTRKFMIFLTVALTVAAVISIVQTRFPTEPGQERALLMPNPR
jgi:hypothetical protein